MSAVAHSTPVAVPAASLPLPMYRFTVKQYHGMIKAGISTGTTARSLFGTENRQSPVVL